MEITERMILDRLDLLRKDKEQARLQVVALDGAMQEAENWLKVIQGKKEPDRIPDVEEVFPGCKIVEKAEA